MSRAENLKWSSFLPEGWGALFDELVDAIAREDEGALVEQAKQKFGTLRVYLNRLTSATEVLVDEASRRSARTCERCGEPGALTVTHDGYYQALCEAHRGDARAADENPIVASFRFHPDGTLKEVDRS